MESVDLHPASSVQRWYVVVRRWQLESSLSLHTTQGTSLNPHLEESIKNPDSLPFIPCVACCVACCVVLKMVWRLFLLVCLLGLCRPSCGSITVVNTTATCEGLLTAVSLAGPGFVATSSAAYSSDATSVFPTRISSLAYLPYERFQDRISLLVTHAGASKASLIACNGAEKYPTVGCTFETLATFETGMVDPVGVVQLGVVVGKAKNNGTLLIGPRSAVRVTCNAAEETCIPGKTLPLPGSTEVVAVVSNYNDFPQDSSGVAPVTLLRYADGSLGSLVATGEDTLTVSLLPFSIDSSLSIVALSNTQFGYFTSGKQTPPVFVSFALEGSVWARSVNPSPGWGSSQLTQNAFFGTYAIDPFNGPQMPAYTRPSLHSSIGVEISNIHILNGADDIDFSSPHPVAFGFGNMFGFCSTTGALILGYDPSY